MPGVQTRPSARVRRRDHSFGLLLLLAFLTIGINGYHPYSEDGGIYVAGVKHAANSGLFGVSLPFIKDFSKLSYFSDCIAWTSRTLHLSLDPLLFLLQIATTWLMLYACLGVARRCFQTRQAQWAATGLVALCFSVPVAGTALFIMDPYLTSRSFSTPLTVLAVCACVDRKMLRAALLLMLVALFHPLMAIYAASYVCMLWAVQRKDWAIVAGLMASAVVVAAAIQFSLRGLSESEAYHAAVMTRSYFFLSRWQWYELFGLAAPLLIMAAFSIRRRHKDHFVRAELALACVAVGVTSVVVSLLLARLDAETHLIAAMQVLRSFLLVYIFMFLLLGGMVGELWLRQLFWRWAVLCLILGVPLGLLQHRAYPASPHVEFPGIRSSNGWRRAFLWIRANTPQDAVVALDSDYIHATGEDAQGFRAIAERSSLADASKDGGAAAAFPQLAEQWMREQTAQQALNQIGDAERLRRLKPFHVSWIVLDRSAVTSLPCPFEDNLVKVCRL